MNAIITVIGKDQVGIIAMVCNLLAEHNVNVLDINQTIMRDMFTMIMLVDMAGLNSSYQAIGDALKAAGAEKGLSIQIQREEIFDAMHKV